MNSTAYMAQQPINFAKPPELLRKNFAPQPHSLDQGTSISLSTARQRVPCLVKSCAAVTASLTAAKVVALSDGPHQSASFSSCNRPVQYLLSGLVNARLSTIQTITSSPRHRLSPFPTLGGQIFGPRRSAVATK